MLVFAHAALRRCEPSGDTVEPSTGATTPHLNPFNGFFHDWPQGGAPALGPSADAWWRALGIGCSRAAGVAARVSGARVLLVVDPGRELTHELVLRELGFWAPTLELAPGVRIVAPRSPAPSAPRTGGAARSLPPAG